MKKEFHFCIIIINNLQIFPHVPSIISEDDCGWSQYADAGIEGGSRIVGGWEARLNEFPYQISVQWRGSHVCGGSLLDRYHVLTAAHCTDG